MKEILLEAKFRWESHMEVNIKMVREKGVKGKKHKFQKQEEFWGVTFAETYSILLEVVQIMCQGSEKEEMR